jgi:hypothetical protein
VSNMGEASAQAELGNGVGVGKFFAGREALIAKEKQHRSGKLFLECSNITVGLMERF